MAIKMRRVVTGLNAEGRSRVLFDSMTEGLAGSSSDDMASYCILWKSEEATASNEGDADQSHGQFDLDMISRNGSNFVAFEVAPGADPPLMHATNSLDYLIVLRGRIQMTLETETVALGVGDIIVDRGVLHGWTVIGDEPALLVGVTVKAHPLGAGARVEV